MVTTLLLLLVAIGGGGYLVKRLGTSDDDNEVDRALRRTQLWSIADLPDATTARVVGIARARNDQHLVAPVSGRPCLFYAIRIVTKNASFRESEGLEIDVDDGTGTAIVDTGGAVAALSKTTIRNTPFTAPTQRQCALLDAHGYEGSFLDVYYEEEIVVAGDTIAVAGLSRRIPDQIRIDKKPGKTRGWLLIGNAPGVVQHRLPQARIVPGP